MYIYRERERVVTRVYQENLEKLPKGIEHEKRTQPLAKESIPNSKNCIREVLQSVQR